MSSSKKVSFVATPPYIDLDVCNQFSDMKHKIDVDYLKFRRSKIAISMHKLESVNAKVSITRNQNKKVRKITTRLRFTAI